MEKIFATQTAEDATNRALELIAAFAVLIVAGLIFAGAGTRDARAKSAEGAALRSSMQSKVDYAPTAQRSKVEQHHASAVLVKR